MPLFSDSSAAADIEACRALLRTGSRSFYAASFLLPRHVREPASALYAFCRLADDAVDIDCASGAIERLQVRLDRVYGGSPEDHPADRAMTRVVERYAIPKHVPGALVEGLAWDCDGRGYDTLDDLHAYAARVAGTVGVMMALVMGVRAPNALARAVDLGIAMQLTNIARDVGEDARLGRIYLPREWLADAGMDADEWLSAPRFTPELALVTKRLLDVADGLYARADDGIAGLPKGCRPGILAARILYSEIGHEVRRNGFDSVRQRAVVSAPRKMRKLAGLLGSLADAAAAEQIRCLEPARFLLTGIGDTAPAMAGSSPRWWDFQGQAIWVLDLFERLEHRNSALVRTSPERMTA